MAYFSLHAYDADVWVQEFRGLNQADIEMNPDPRFAAEAENVETIHGVLQPQAANDILDGPSVMVEVEPGEYENQCPRIETLAVMHRRWYEGEGSKNWYICCAGGKLYEKQAGSTEGWAEIDLPVGVDAYQCSAWSWVTYETQVDTDNDSNPDTTVDVLLMSNAKDGMIMVIPPETMTTWHTVSTTYTWETAKELNWAKRANNDPPGLLTKKWSIEPVDTRTNPEDPDEPQKKFGVIERFAERIFGTARDGEPDTLYYSKAYYADDWTPNYDIPEESAGEIPQPSWDGDSFHALKRFGDQLLAFKKNKIWRIMGTNPGEYSFAEQYGHGTEYFNTICVEGERVYMADRNGVAVYDGMNTTPFGKDQIEQIWRTVNINALDQMCAALFDKRYYLAFPTGQSTVNNAMLVFDLNEGDILFYPDMMIEAFLPTDEVLFATSSEVPGKIIQINYDSWKHGTASGVPTKWVSPWMDFGYKRIQKGGFDFYFLPEVKDEAVTFTISIQTEKKKKTKLYTCKPLTEEQLAVPKEHRMKKLHFSGTGRKFRIIIEVTEGNINPWRIIGGLQLVVETDPD